MSNSRVMDGEISVIEANPRASRTVPFASKATGVNLVEAACRLMAGALLSTLALPERRRGGEVCVKAAVLPFARFPGSDTMLGPEMRATGEVMASADDFPTAFAKAERAAGRPLPKTGTVFLSVRDADKRPIVPIAAALAGLGFHLVATTGTAGAVAAAGIAVDVVAKVSETTDGRARRSSTSSGAEVATSSSTRPRSRALPAATGTSSVSRRCPPASRA